MSPKSESPDEVPAGTHERVAEVARGLFARLPDVRIAIRNEVEQSIPELVGDPALRELLDSTIQTNVELFLDYAKGNVALEEIVLPAAAMAYSRRLAQRGVSTVAPLRVYRIGQRRVATEALKEISRTEPDPGIAYAAAGQFHEMTFAYVDHVSQQVVAAYELERERWLANRNTVRTAMVASIVDGTTSGIGVAEPVLGYRLRQKHVGVVLWDPDSTESVDSLARLERLLTVIASTVFKPAKQLFIPRDQSQAWGWISTGADTPEIEAAALESILGADGDFASIKVAVGRGALGIDGFRTTHLEAMRAFGVASADDRHAAFVTTFADTGVRVASLLSGNMTAAREMVAGALGGLAANDEWVEQLRETLGVFFEESFSYSAVSKRLHMHRNTVKYRLDKATELRGRPLDVDAVELQLALLLARSLGQSVLAH